LIEWIAFSIVFMPLRGTVTRAVELLAVIVVLSLVVGQALGTPVGLSYVETGSMEPTLEPGDGFVAVPAELAGPVEEGDVVVFRAQEIQGGGLTTHRVVGETERGYVTRGDANPFTDQDGDEPPVKEAQVVAVAFQPGGQVVAIPGLGAAVEGTQAALETVQRVLAGLFGTRALLGAQGLAYLFFAVTALWYVVGEWRAREGRDRDRSRSRTAGLDPRLIAAAFALLLVAGATAAMVAPAGTQEYTIVSAAFESEQPTVIPTGESNDIPYRVPNGGFVPVVAYLEPASDGVDATPEQVRVPPRSVANATLTLQAPPETGAYRRYVVEHRYLAVLPTSTIDALYRVHPWAPIVVIDALLGVPFYVGSVALLGRGRVRRRSRDRGGSSRLRRLVDRYT
jgi:signal peptidase